jgi:altronate dehydratase
MKNNLPKYGLLEKYNEERQQGLQVQQNYAEKVNVAEALVKALEYRYNEAVREVVAEGTDNRQELAKIKKEKSAAIADLEHAREIQRVARTINSNGITIEDLRIGLKEYQRKFQNGQIDPEVDKLEKIKIEYLKQFIEIQRRIKFFEDEARKAFNTVNPRYGGYSIPYSVGFGTQSAMGKACITSYDLQTLQRGELPNSVKGANK